MLEPKRQLYLLKPETTEDHAGFERLLQLLVQFQPSEIMPAELQVRGSIDGNVLLIPSFTWPQGVLSELTHFMDLSILALLADGEDQDRVGLWYVLGASLVLDESASPAVLKGALARMLEVEVQTLRPNLTRKENMLFEVLRRAGRSGLDRSTLAERIWGNVAVQPKTIDVHVFNLRRKLNGTRYRINCEAGRFCVVQVSESGEVD